MNSYFRAIAVISIISVIAIIGAIAYTNYLSGIKPTSKLVFTTGNGQIVEVSQMSTAITIQRKDRSGSQITSDDLIVNLASNSSTGNFYATSSSTTPITNITIPNSQPSIPVYFSDSEIGTPTLTAYAKGYISTNTTITLRPSQYIGISYSYNITQSVIDKNGDLRVPNSGYVFLVMNIALTNNGYNATFSTHSEHFYPVANGKRDFGYITFLSLSDWDWTLSLPDGESYSGVIVFQVPESLSNASFSLIYKTNANTANPYIIWSKM